MLPNGADVGASSSAGGVTEAPLSISDLAKPVNTSSTDPSQIIYRAPSPGGPVEILEIPESPSNPSPGPSGDSSLFPFASPHLNETGVKAEASGHTVAHPTTENPIQTYERVLQDHAAVADLLQQIHRDLRTTVPGGFQAESLAEMLEKTHGPEKMTEIRQSLETQRAQSSYFREVQVHFRTLRNSGGTEMQLRKEWQGRA
jgi:hypothetical protein